jgi:hypothetical protein
MTDRERHLRSLLILARGLILRAYKHLKIHDWKSAAQLWLDEVEKVLDK